MMQNLEVNMTKNHQANKHKNKNMSKKICRKQYFIRKKKLRLQNHSHGQNKKTNKNCFNFGCANLLKKSPISLFRQFSCLVRYKGILIPKSSIDNDAPVIEKFFS